MEFPANMIGAVLFFVLLAGCLTPYKPPNYICACSASCYQKSEYEGQIFESTDSILNSAPIGGKTPQETKEKCLKEATKLCPGQVVDLICTPTTWEEWNRAREDEIKSGGRR
ncbi:MAG: hypothetical protein QXN37_03900 [Candidatus Anstonellaceae archaeon]